MSEEKTKTTETTTATTTKTQKEHTEPKVRIEHSPVHREKTTSRWTLKICLKTAARFTTEEEWKTGAPSCYKAACAHAWRTECLKHLRHTTTNIAWKKSA